MLDSLSYSVDSWGYFIFADSTVLRSEFSWEVEDMMDCIELLGLLQYLV